MVAADKYIMHDTSSALSFLALSGGACRAFWSTPRKCANLKVALPKGLKRLRRPSESWAVMQVESGLSLVNPESKPKVTANNIVPFARKAAAVA